MNDQNSTALRFIPNTGLSDQALKLIAIFSMLLDHTGACIFKLLPGWSDTESTVYLIYSLLRLVGRCAFPIYCFTLIEGLIHTKHFWRYLIRLAVFAVLSEIPFDLAFEGVYFETGHQNVFMTLALGLAMLRAFEYMKTDLADKIPPIALKISALIVPAAYFTYRIGSNVRRILGYDLPPQVAYPLCALIGLALIYVAVSNVARRMGDRAARILCGDLVILSVAAETADITRMDYRSAGIVCIALMYLYRHDYIQRMVWGCIALAILSSISELFAFINIPLVSAYNNERGRGPRYLFYIFYPAHLLILYLIARMFGLRGIPTFGPDVLSGSHRLF